jgi:RNA polymerase sigma-54 factor
VLKPALQLTIGQQLAMTPQLQQAIRLLQLSAQELELEIHTALESNVMLETEDEAGWSEAAAESDSSGASDHEPDAAYDENREIEYMSAGGGRGPWEGAENRELEAVEAAPLREHLAWQLEMSPLGQADLAIGVALVDALDDDGYLNDDPEAIRASLEPEFCVDLDEVEAMLHYVQTLDPVGVGARSLGECLRLQLRQFDAATPALEAAAQLADRHLEDLARGDFARIGQCLRIDAATVEVAAALVRSLNPRPGATLAAAPEDYIVPDVVVSRFDGRWRVDLNPAAAPRLRVNDYYASLLRTEPGLHANEMLRSNLKEARWLVRSLDIRHQTLMKVATALVEHQQAFLEHGEEYMQPLILKDIASEIEAHESTVSRVTTNKYMQTPRGVIPFRYFFSNHLATGDGGQRSVTAIRALIRKLVADEDSARPLSDGKIAEQLHARDIQVARRTVAKYREALGIPPKSVRRQSGRARTHRHSPDPDRLQTREAS